MHAIFIQHASFSALMRRCFATHAGNV